MLIFVHQFQMWRGAGVVDLASLERKCTFTGTEGSNPSLSSSYYNSTFIIIFLLTLLLPKSILSQNSDEQWVNVSSDSESEILINSLGLTKLMTAEIYVWAEENFYAPIEMEGIKKKIYQTKTYYLFNVPKKRYSILQIMLFDEDENILKSYSYEHNFDDSDYKYNNPILNGTKAEKIFLKCVDIISSLTN